MSSKIEGWGLLSRALRHGRGILAGGLKKVPRVSLAAGPLTLALALLFCAQALALDPWVGACAALVIYVFSAPFLDRALLSAAHASADTTKRQVP
jgi:hypothetical protein